MNRRGFLGAMLAAGAAPAIVRASSLMPLWVPRVNPYEVIVTVPGNKLLTFDQVTREALRLLHRNMTFIGTVNHQYAASCATKALDTLDLGV